MREGASEAGAISRCKSGPEVGWRATARASQTPITRSASILREAAATPVPSAGTPF